jgi:hypothetical protein
MSSNFVARVLLLTNSHVFSQKRLKVRAVTVREGGYSSDWVDVPRGATSVFKSPQGLIFYNPDELHEAKVVDPEDMGIPGAVAAKAKTKVCRFGANCRDPEKCANRHPLKSSIIPLGQDYPLNQECKYGTSCTT